jgi:hypothetical protein
LVYSVSYIDSISSSIKFFNFFSISINKTSFLDLTVFLF